MDIKKEIERDVIGNILNIFDERLINDELNKLLLSGFVDYLDYKSNPALFIKILTHCIVQKIMIDNSPELILSDMTKKYKKLIKSYR